MMKTWLVVKIHYGDFDVRLHTPVAAGPESLVKEEVERRNAALTEKEKADCVRYEAQWVKQLG